MILEKLNPIFSLRRREEPTITSWDLEGLRGNFPRLPEDYLELLHEASILEIEFTHDSVAQLYPELEPEDGLLMFSLYSAQEAITAPWAYLAVSHVSALNAVAVGMDSGDSVFIYMDGGRGWGLYLLRLTDLEETWIAPTLTELLVGAAGTDAFMRHSYGYS